MKKFLLLITIIVVGWFAYSIITKDNKIPVENDSIKQEMQIDPNNFTTEITNDYFSLPIGRKLVYEGKTEDGVERIVIEITGETKEVMGVTTLIYSDKVYVDDELVEDTKDYLAQDEQGNVWYFGEDVDNYEDGKLVDHDGAWLAGVDGALPGILIKSTHTEGDSYKQEFYAGVAEDVRDVYDTEVTVVTDLATYSDCVQFYDWTPLDSEAREHKYYCPEVQEMVKEVDLVTGNEIVLIEHN